MSQKCKLQIKSFSDNSVEIIEELTEYMLTSTLTEFMSCWVFGSSLRKATTVRRDCFSRWNRAAVKKIDMTHTDLFVLFFTLVFARFSCVKHTGIFVVLDVAAVFMIIF